MLNGNYVYADVTFLVNLVMDFIILWTTAKLGGLRIIYMRLVGAAVLGAVYSVGYLFPHLAGWYSLPLKIVFSFILVILAFWPSSWKEFKAAIMYFYGVSFAVAGAVMSSAYLFKTSPAFNFSYTWLLGGVFCAFCLGKWGERVLAEKLVGIMGFPVRLVFDGVSCQGEGLVDTGNSLQDPLTHRPVVVAEYDLIRDCLPEDVRRILDTAADSGSCIEAMTTTSWAHRLRLIPFNSIGKSHGLLLGLRCDEVIIDTGQESVNHQNIVIGIYQERLSPEGKFQMLLPAKILLKG